ncbi:MAG TPA: FHA domain-containing protein [Aggregatilineales bacterium]|nr:FHA domain-containing protein [Aggregatilineales bacterium]
MDVILFALRVAAALLLMAFVGAVLVMLWRDFQAVSQEIDTRTRRRGRLVVLHSTDGINLPGKSFPLLPLTTLGRSPSNTVHLDDVFASAEHAMLTLRSGQWWLEDRGSSNGTRLNGYRVEEPIVLSAGDVIGIGQIELKLELEE